MKLIINYTRHYFFAIMLLGLGIYISCKDITSGVPPFIPKVEVKDTPTEDFSVDTTSLHAEEITVTSSSMSNAAAEDLANTLADASTPEAKAKITTVSSAVTSSVNSTQQTYWAAQNETTIIDGVNSGNTNMQSQIEIAQTAFQNNPNLSEYIPGFQDAVGRIMTDANGRSYSAFSIEGEIYVDSEINQELTSCILAWRAWKDSVIAVNKLKYNTSVDLINGAFNREKAKLDANKKSLETGFNATFEERITHYKGLWSSANTKLSNAVTNQNISASEGEAMKILNSIVLAINAYKAKTLKEGEFNLALTKYNTNFGKISASKTALSKVLSDKFNTLVDEVNAIVEENTKDCHDQGGNQDQIN